MRSRVHLLCLCILSAGAGNPAAADARTTAKSCRAAHTHTLVQNRQARVYRRGDTILGCAYSRGRSTTLGTTWVEPQSSSGGSGVKLLRLAQRFVAVATRSIDPGHGNTWLDIVDLRSGRKVYRRFPGARIGADSDITDVVLDHAGSVAYIEIIHDYDPRRVMVVRKHDSNGSALLQRGGDVDPTSLTLTGDLLSWISDGETRTATLR